MIELWTFEQAQKAEAFLEILAEHGIEFERRDGPSPVKGATRVTVLVAEDDLEKAKRVLTRHRKRRTSADMKRTKSI